MSRESTAIPAKKSRYFLPFTSQSPDALAALEYHRDTLEGGHVILLVHLHPVNLRFCSQFKSSLILVIFLPLYIYPTVGLIYIYGADAPDASRP